MILLFKKVSSLTTTKLDKIIMMDAMFTLFSARYGRWWIYKVLFDKYKCAGSCASLEAIEAVYKTERKRKENAEPTIANKLPPGHYFKYWSAINAAIIQHFNPEIKQNEAIKIGGEIYLEIMGNPDFYKVDDDMRIFIETAIERGFDFCLVTNQEKVSIQKLLNYFKVADLFKYIVVSDEVGYKKPDPRFFLYTKSILREPRSKRIAFLGNNPINDMEGAANAGINYRFLFDPKNEHAGTLTHVSYIRLEKVSDIIKILADAWIDE